MKKIHKEYHGPSHSELVKEYTKNIKEKIDSNPNLNPYTVTIRLKKVDINQGSFMIEYPFLSEPVWNTYERVYVHVASRLTNNFSRKPTLQPLTFDFLDVNGTKDSRYACFTPTTIPHIHSIYLVHDAVKGKFDELMAESFFSVITHPKMADIVSSIHAKPVTDLQGAISYASKFYDNAYAKKLRNDYPLFNQFPVPKSQRRTNYGNRPRIDIQVIARQKPIFKHHVSNHA